MRLLVVDDDAEVRDLVVRALERDGHVVSAVSSVQAARRSLADRSADVIVLDIGLPDATGIDFCRELRAARSDVPVLMLTARSEVANRVSALDAGADDFLGKPFAVAELRARVRALARRRKGTLAIAVWQRAGLRIDISARRAERDGSPIALTAREWAIVEALAARAGRVVTRADLLEEVWGAANESSAASLEVLIARVRRKLGEGVVRTLRGEGYALEPDEK
jgi:two-component system, OmpR family, response regulator